MSDDRHKRFLRLYTPVQSALLRYVCTLHPNFSEVEDILQDVVVVAWEKFPEYESAESEYDFASWIFGVARYKILHSKRKFMRSNRLLEEAQDHLAQQYAVDFAGEAIERQQALARCIRKLSDKHRTLVIKRYFEKVSCFDLAEQLQQTDTQIRSQLYRLRGILRNCISEVAR
jgi:RNA polymerase sigma-70 factor, ECF subfamily